MIFIYRTLFLPLFLVALPHYVRRMVKRGGYKQTLVQRLGFVPRLETPAHGVKRIWVQAVSVGEYQAIAPVLKELASRKDIEIVLTVTTSTAYELATKQMTGVCRLVCAFPIDFWLCSRLAWRRIRPDLALMMEGELWPEHLHQARERSVPVLLVNARLSDRSFQRYRKLKFVARHLVLRPLSLVLAGNEQDVVRFERLGLLPQRLRYVGQLKCDVPLEPELSPEERQALRKELFPGLAHDGLVLLGSSTWPGEEAFLLNVLHDMREENGDVRLLIVPRHAERRDEICRLLEGQSLPWQLRSREKPGKPDTVVYVADTTGELRVLMQAADAAFIGKSLTPHNEGQTPIESAGLGIPTVMGPGMSNFRGIAQSLRESAAAIQAHDDKAVRAVLLEMMRSPERRRSLSTRGRQWYEAQRGARAAIIETIDTILTVPESVGGRPR